MGTKDDTMQQSDAKRGEADAKRIEADVARIEVDARREGADDIRDKVLASWCASFETRLGKVNGELGEVIKDVGWLKGRMDLLVWLVGMSILAVVIDIIVTLL